MMVKSSFNLNHLIIIAHLTLDRCFLSTSFEYRMDDVPLEQFRICTLVVMKNMCNRHLMSEPQMDAL